MRGVPWTDLGTLEDMKRLLILTSGAAMIGMAAPAYADDPPSGADADFIGELKAAGLTEQDPAKAIAAAKDMCSLMDNGTPDTVIKDNLVSRNPGLTPHDATEFMTLAKGKYCSKYLTGEGQPPKPTGEGQPPKSTGEGQPPKPPGAQGN
jgi:Protein of unknown function (DUF732)